MEKNIVVSFISFYNSCYFQLADVAKPLLCYITLTNNKFSLPQTQSLHSHKYIHLILQHPQNTDY